MSAPVGIDCGIHCTYQYYNTDVVTLTAAADTGSGFLGWSGCDITNGAECPVTMTWDTTITATFAQDVTVTVTETGTGHGTVTSDPAGISCITTTASSVFPAGIVVTMTAVADAGSGFAGWTGCGSTAGNICNITTTANATINAVFAHDATVIVSKTGTGTGTVSSVPAGINCGATCSSLFSGGTALALTAAADAGSTFQSWTGCDSVTAANCFITVSKDLTATAQFGHNATVAVAKSGTGTGTVSSVPAGINCGATCSYIYGPGMVVKLTAAPDTLTLNVFQGWTGCTAPNGATCTITTTADVSVTAQFATGDTLTVTKTGSSTGTRIYSNPAGISCLSGCSSGAGTFAAGQDVTLYASTDSSADFAYWTGECAGISKPVCTVTMSGPISVGAAFAAAKTPKYNLMVTKTKKSAGDGVVSSSDDTIHCGASCRNSYYMGTPISLTAVADAGSTFTGWAPASLNCPGTAPCLVSMGWGKSVRAVFVGPQKLVVTKQRIGQGNGSVASNPAGINLNDFGTRAEAKFVLNDVVSLTAIPDGNSVFTGWKPAALGCPGTAPCAVTMDKAHTATAVFTKASGLGQSYPEEEGE